MTKKLCFALITLCTFACAKQTKTTSSLMNEQDGDLPPPFQLQNRLTCGLVSPTSFIQGVGTHRLDNGSKVDRDFAVLSVDNVNFKCNPKPMTESGIKTWACDKGQFEVEKVEEETKDPNDPESPITRVEAFAQIYSVKGSERSSITKVKCQVGI